MTFDLDAIVEARRSAAGEPFSFKLNGKVYTTLPEIQVTSLTALVEEGLDSTIDFIAQALVEEDRDSFRTLAAGKQPVHGDKKGTKYVFAPKTLEDLTQELTKSLSGKEVTEKS